MTRSRVFSIITIICFCSIIFVPIGLVTMWYSTAWKKKIKFILSAAFTVLYAGIVVLLLNLEPAVNTSGVALPFSYSSGETAFETSVSSKPKKADKKNGYNKAKKKSDQNKDEIREEERLPKSVKKQKGKNLDRRFYMIMFFLFMLFLILWQNFKNGRKKGNYENPYVDTNQYKLPLADDAKMPLVHYQRLHLNPNERIYFATETTQKDKEGDFIVTNQRVVILSRGGDYEFPIGVLSAVSSVSNSVMLLTSGERKYYIFMPESQMKYALAIVRWVYSKATSLTQP